MTEEEAISKACADVGIIAPKGRAAGRWLKTDTLSGRNGKGDGRVMINDACVTGFNWQTGETVTVWLQDQKSPVVRRQMREQIAKHGAEQKKRADRAAKIAGALVAVAVQQTHSYLEGKGFPDEKVLVVGADAVAEIAGRYLVPDGGKSAIVVPARVGTDIRNAQLIWECGEKKFLYGGQMEGASHRISTGRDCWHCEGLSTGLSLRAAFQALRANVTILCCFSASNVEAVTRFPSGRPFIATDNDKPLPQYDGMGAGEYFAKRSGVPFLMPPQIGDDFNDLHQREGVFVVQRLICDFLKGIRT
ncbi:toprim domain-containing protein [Pararhizobium gei]|uniref:toprim domain-containing protein n=1 Tax=Pararhizobium gei TaxID=1395951 RepID=UPI0023DBADB1|nr:toprim domain-containing protein [Rhizobium gei]